MSVGRTGYLGLGSNVGERREHLQAAADELSRQGLAVDAASSTYDTEPVGLVLDQPEFLNACLRIVTGLDPESLLDTCKATERAVGRRPGIRHGPRVIDVDLLLLGDVELVSDRLALPHPEVTARRFVLVPLLELEPGLSLPDGTPLAAALDALGPGQAVRRAGPPLALPA
ncbi:MAG TPA: 2-amino-4-hydroxy-6-hydroxymethyldihydropteridine diphosphokinase [Solirubrobacteraceae bacterium]|nr:2-amino-4-hydroxy-6-hydroxymethyldihydropteridine diphosphokinase [Solirubrobacteraceae bacterium]